MVTHMKVVDYLRFTLTIKRTKGFHLNAYLIIT